MARLTPTFCAALSLFIFTSSPAIKAQEISKYDEGPFAGMGYPYSESARVGDLLFLSGQAGENHQGKLVTGGIKAEAEQLLLNIEGALARRGLTTKHVVKCTVFLADMAEWGAFNEIYKKHFSKPYPARSALGVKNLWADARVEMECIAAFPS